MRGAAGDVDTYIEAAPEAVRGKLAQLRATIKAACPEAQERISYQMPYYDYHGRLAYFGVARNHIGLYVPTPVVAEHRQELAGYKAAGATIRFPIDKPLPVALITKLVKARMQKNEALAATRPKPAGATRRGAPGA